ncbi:MAG: DUF4386 family protein [Chloroflexi bacterium]|nr:DUF4386 family protein [Chloroflexota bacterium]
MNRAIAALLIIAAIAGGASVILPQVAVGAIGGDADLDALGAIRNIDDNKVLYLVGYALDALANIALVLLAALLYVMFRGRNHLWATVVFATVLATGAVLMVVTILGFSGQALASSVPSELPSESRRLMESFAEWLAALAAYGTAIGYTFGAIGLIALGRLIVSSPMSGAASVAGSTVPRPVGLLAIVAGVVLLSVWLTVINAVLLPLTLLGVALTLLTELVLAGWLLMSAIESAPVE